MSGMTKDEVELRERVAKLERDNFRLAQEKEILLTTLARAALATQAWAIVNATSHSAVHEANKEAHEVLAHFEYDDQRIARVAAMGRVTLPVKS